MGPVLVTMRTFIVSAFVAYSTLALAAPSAKSTLKLKESVVAPRGWTKREAAPRDLPINLRIALPQSNFPLLEQHLYEVRYVLRLRCGWHAQEFPSDPSHARYGAHLSKEEVNELIAPPPESVDAVTSWLAAHGLDEGDLVRSPAGDWIKVKVPVSLAEEMFDTVSVVHRYLHRRADTVLTKEYHVWEHTSGDMLVRTTAYSLPEHLHSHVELVQPTTLFSRFRGMKTTFHFTGEAVDTSSATSAPAISVPSASGGQVDASCNTTITVSCLKQLYNAVGYTPLNNTGNQIAATGYLDQFADLADLQSFFAEEVPEAVGSTFDLVSINGW